MKVKKAKFSSKVLLREMVSKLYLLVLLRLDALADVSVYVSTGALRAGADGSAINPFPSIPEAQEHVRQLRVGGEIGEVVIHIAKGLYPPFAVHGGDSGLHAGPKTIYRGVGINTRISGGTEIPPSLFKPTKTLPEEWQVQILLFASQ